MIYKRQSSVTVHQIMSTTSLALVCVFYLCIVVCLDMHLVAVAFSAYTIPYDKIKLKNQNRYHHSKNIFVIYGTGADIEQPPVIDESGTVGVTNLVGNLSTSNTAGGSSVVTTSVTVTATTTTNDNSNIRSTTKKSAAAIAARNKVNEIDFCIAPADVSLSRAYGISTENGSSLSSKFDNTDTTIPVSSGVGLSLTLALNDASNRAIRRILLARSWPSAEALNLSLRQVALAESKRAEQERQLVMNQDANIIQESSNNENNNNGIDSSSTSSAKCPVPRPILNVLTRQSSKQQAVVPPKARSRTDEEYVTDQLISFRERYGSLPAYEYAEDYLASVLSLATSGIESNRASKVLQAGYYSESYKRMLSVLRTVGVQFEITKDGKQQIASKLLDQDICLSMIDKIQMKQEKNVKQLLNEEISTTSTSEVEKVTISSTTTSTPSDSVVDEVIEGSNKSDSKTNKNNPLLFWKSRNKNDSDTVLATDLGSDENGSKLTKEDLGGVLLSASEPTMTRQLNVLSNIIQRALLFGGDQELLVLAETLDADMPVFIKRWYSTTTTEIEKKNSIQTNVIEEKRPGVQYLKALIKLLRNCYMDGSIKDLYPPVPLSNSYANAYERLVASAVELGSGYMKPIITATMTLPPPSILIKGSGTTTGPSSSITAAGSVPVSVSSSIPKPRTAQEGIGQFAIWESSARTKVAAAASMSSSHPADMVGIWEIRDEISGKTLGSSMIKLLENGDVEVPPPLEGLRWRLDPGPTHLDTCTFQVLSVDGTVLQYRGFIDRGARLEARFSKRQIKVRGSVMFQMRDSTVGIDYYRDMLPINYRQGTTKFIMTKQVVLTK